MNQHIIEADADPRYFEVEEWLLREYADEIEDVLWRAYGDGLIITVEQASQAPLAMGHYTTEFTVRPMRKPEGWPNTEVDKSHPLARLFDRNDSREAAILRHVPRQSKDNGPSWPWVLLGILLAIIAEIIFFR